MVNRQAKLLSHLNRFNQRIADIVLARNPLREEAIFMHDKIELDQYHDAHTISGEQTRKMVVVNKNPDLEYVQELGGDVLLDDMVEQEPWIIVASVTGFKELPRANDHVLIGDMMYSVSQVKPLNRDAQSVIRVLIYPERNDIPFRIVIYDYKLVDVNEDGSEWRTDMKVGYVGGEVDEVRIGSETYEGDYSDISYQGVVKVIHAISKDGQEDSYRFDSVVRVTFVVLGEVVSVQYIQTGADAVPPETEEEVDDSIFIGWDTPYTAVEGDTVITAVYKMINDTRVDIKLGDIVVGSFTLNSDTDQVVEIPARAMGITDIYQGDKLVGSIPANQVGDQSIHLEDVTPEVDTTSLEKLENKVTTISDKSTDDEYPTAKLLYDLVDELSKSIESVKETAGGDVRYTDTDPMEEAHGGISAGTTFNDVPVTEVLRQILHKPTGPVVTLSASPSAGSYEVGTTLDVTLTAKVVKKTDLISNASLNINGSLIGGFVVKDPKLANGGTYTYQTTISADTKAFATCTDKGGRTVNSGNLNYSFRTPVFYGLATEAEILDGSVFTKKDTKRVVLDADSKTDYKTPYPAFDTKRFFFALEGSVSVCKNPSLFVQTDSLNVLKTAVTLKDGKAHDYTIYYSDDTTQGAEYPCYWTFKISK